MTPFESAVLAVSVIISAPSAFAGILGTNTPSQPLTAGRIAALPRAQRTDWQQYLARSQRQLQADQSALKNEMRRLGLKEAIAAPSGRGTRSLPLNRDAEWYRSADARRLADIVVSFQTPAGGWCKNMDFSQHVRAPGEHFAADNTTRFPAPGDNDAPRDVGWNFVGTFDNDATITQMRFLARVITALGEKSSAPYRAAFSRGLDYIFAAQFPNGGWPQVWPLQGGYHDAITYNDGAMLHVLALLRDVADGGKDFSFFSQRTRRKADASFKRGIVCLLQSQVVVNGRRTVWGQQHDTLTLQPVSARNYEMPALTAGESGEIVIFLMQLPSPSPEIVTAVHAAADWFQKTAQRDVAFRFNGAEDRQLVPAPGNGPLWSRYYEIGSDRPIFGDRDKSIHDNVNEISLERRRGYSWFSEKGQAVLDRYASWRKLHPPP
ncbi:MAG: pectate lyase [Pedosphaera sp.]|nr:pectate lyase [Pedosphaera sp.]